MTLLNFDLDPQPPLPFHAAALFAAQALEVVYTAEAGRTATRNGAA